MPKIVLYYPLTDKMLPFTEAKLKGIVSNPARVVEEQWKIEAETQDEAEAEDFETRRLSNPQ